LAHVGEVLLKRSQRTILESGRALESVAEFVNRLEHVAIVDLACARLMASGYIADMKVPDAIDVGPDILDQIPFHDLNVVNVEKQLHVRAAEAVDQFGAVADVVQEVPGVVHVSVEDLYNGCHAVLFQNGSYLSQSRGRIGHLL